MTGDALELGLRAVLIGAGGSAMMDAWGLAARRALGVRGLDYGLLGRWIGHLGRGRFAHERIAAAAPIRWERPLGWAAHYAIGMTFALGLLLVWGLDWATSPTLGPAIAVGLGTIVAPWLVMQPAMGMGIAASRSPRPGAARLRNLITHLVYGVGLYLAAIASSAVWP